MSLSATYSMIPEKACKTSVNYKNSWWVLTDKQNNIGSMNWNQCFDKVSNNKSILLNWENKFVQKQSSLSSWEIKYVAQMRCNVHILMEDKVRYSKE